MNTTKKIKFSIRRMNDGNRVVCRSVCFTPIIINVKEKHIDVLLQHGFSKSVNGEEIPAPKYWHNYYLNGKFWGDIDCGMDLAILME